MIAQDWEQLLFLHGGPIHASIPPENVQRQRFARLFGFEPLLTLTDLGSGTSQLIYRTKD